MKQPVKKMEIKEGASGAFFIKNGCDTIAGFWKREHAEMFLNSLHNEIYYGGFNKKKENELYRLKEKKKQQAIKDERKSEIYKKTKSEFTQLESVLNNKSISNCPFCGGNGVISAMYDSDDNRPDGQQNYIECSDCLAQGESFYCETICEQNLSQEQFIIQEKNRIEKMISAIEAWNKRTL